ncbi:MAG: AraC family transcriptional regulator, partial [Hyphococcus sp.]
MGDVSCRYLKSYFDTCVDNGCAPERLTAALGEGDAPFDNPARRFSNESVLNMMHAAEAMAPGCAIGLAAGRDFRPSTFLDIGLALISSATLREALAVNEKYQALTQQLGKTRFNVSPGSAMIVWRPYLDDPERMRPVTEAVFAGYAVFGRWLTWLYDKEIASMQFRHKRPPHADECNALFGCEVVYEARIDQMSLDPALADMPLPNANPELLSVLCKR